MTPTKPFYYLWKQLSRVQAAPVIFDPKLKQKSVAYTQVFTEAIEALVKWLGYWKRKPKDMGSSPTLTTNWCCSCYHQKVNLLGNLLPYILVIHLNTL